jgi:hypothetical protein
MERGTRTGVWMLAAGLTVGLTIGGAMTVGVLLGKNSGDKRTSEAAPSFNGLQLKAMASHGGENFAIATGPVDDDVEGLFTLDFLTGDLQCFVINPRNGAMGGWFKTNVSAALSVERGKKPSYLIACGNINTSGGYGGSRPAASLCYVADANTGEIAAFSFPWTKAATSAGVAQATEMRMVGKWKARNLPGQ